ncbi:MAG: alginate lyase family protein [Acidimicrobiales bacterium]|nr:alginate lyase family protein [Acidimicrobiales bacterium]
MVDQVWDTFCHATTRYERVGGVWRAVDSPASWRAVVPDGVYRVTVLVGESLAHSSSIAHSVQVEGVVVHDRVLTSSAVPVVSGTVDVVVSDGLLDMTFDGGSKTKVVAVEIESIDGGGTTTTTTTAAPTTTTTSTSTTTTTSTPPSPEGSPIAEYGFGEGSDVFASDSAPVPFPNDLFFGYYGPGWMWTNGGVAFESGVAATPGPASRLTSRLAETGRTTVEVWLDPGPPDQDDGVVVALADTAGSYSFMLLREGPNLVWRVGSGSSQIAAPAGAGTQHTALVVDGQTIEMWLNGSLIDSVTAAGQSPLISSELARLTVGGLVDGTQSWVGDIDHLRITDGVTPADRLATRTAQSPSDLCLPPVAAVRGGAGDADGRTYRGVLLPEAEMLAASASSAAVDDLMARAQAMLCQSPLSVVANGGGNTWNTDSAYTSDGIFDDLADRHDYRAAERLSRGLVSLGWAYRRTGDGAYAEKALQLIDAWAIDPQTRWVPAVSDTSRDIEIYITQPGIIYGADLIWSYPGWTPQQRSDFEQWAERAAVAFAAGDADANIDSWRMAASAVAAAFAGRTDLLDDVFNRYGTLIDERISSTGVMSTEIDRTRSLFYSVFHISALTTLAEVARSHGTDLYAATGSSGQSLRTAFDYVAPFLAQADPAAQWPYEEIGPLWPQDTPIAVFEVASVRYPDADYSAVFDRWERPLFQRVVLGPVTFSHSTLGP